MWLDRLTVVRASQPLSEAQIAELLVPFLAGLPSPPRMVIDARPPSSRAGATATYRLLAALGLRDAAPAAIYLHGGVDGAYGALDALVAICPDAGSALIISIVNGTDMSAVVCCIAARSTSPSPNAMEVIRQFVEFDGEGSAT